MVQDIWRIPISGSPAYILARKLQLLRTRLKSWCLDKKLFWGVNWKRIFVHLHSRGSHITSIVRSVDYTRCHNQAIREATKNAR